MIPYATSGWDLSPRASFTIPRLLCNMTIYKKISYKHTIEHYTKVGLHYNTCVVPNVTKHVNPFLQAHVG